MQRGRMNPVLSRRFGAGLAAFGLSLLGVSAPSLAGIVLQHLPTGFAGPASDTEFFIGAAQSGWQRLADEIILDEEASIRMVNWWGFYAENNPPITETMRVRFYAARPGDGLPDDANILFEESFHDPARTPTGQIVFADVDADEFFFEVELSSEVTLAADTLYWLEIAQIGDPDTRFRWEFGETPIINGHAFINHTVLDWQHTISTISDQAFQLSAIPEPSTLFLVLTAALSVWFRGGRSGKPHGCQKAQYEGGE